jgi:uncharacterized protein YpbB
MSFKYPNLRKYLKKFYDKRAYSYEENSKIIGCIREQIKSCDKITKLLSSNIIEEILNSSAYYSHEAIDNLFTITSLIEENICKTSTIEKYY